MGVVYRCRDPRLNRTVAIKVLRESQFLTPVERAQYEARFRHEAEAAGRLSHPQIVQIYDVGPSYMVMEHLEGRTLASLLKHGPRLLGGQGRARSWASWPTPSSTPTATASSIATSSPPT